MSQPRTRAGGSEAEVMQDECSMMIEKEPAGRFPAFIILQSSFP
jgi:hypothetical protein